MGIPLYDVTVLSFIQTVQALEGVLQRGLTYCGEQGIDPSDLVKARLHPDMLPFSFQVFSIAKNSVGAIECVRAGHFGKPPPPPEFDYAGLQRCLAEASAKLASYTRDEIDALQGRELVFHPGEQKVIFNSEDFLLSFSLPNFHFHATTAYDILRAKGVPIGKRDYLGRLRIKR